MDSKSIARERRIARWKRYAVWYSFIIVSIITLAILVYLPMLTSVKYSLYKVSSLGFGEEFIGFRNYNLILTNGNFRRAVYNTIVLALMGLLSIPVGFVLATLINSVGKNKMQSFFRIGYYLPNIITGVSVILIFQVVLKTNDGLLNNFLSMITGRDISIGWLTDKAYGKWGATILGVWSNLGYSMLINLASLQAIPREVYEAAEVDGASGFKSWIYITIPQMVSCFAFLFITGMIGGLARFTDLFILGGNTTAGRPGGTLQTIMMYIYQYSFETPNYGMASAGAMVLFTFTLAITLVNLKLTGFFSKKKD